MTRSGHILGRLAPQAGSDPVSLVQQPDSPADHGAVGMSHGKAVLESTPRDEIIATVDR